MHDSPDLPHHKKTTQVFFSDNFIKQQIICEKQYDTEIWTDFFAFQSIFYRLFVIDTVI